MTAWEAALLRITSSCTFRCGRSSPTSADVVNHPVRTQLRAVQQHHRDPVCSLKCPLLV